MSKLLEAKRDECIATCHVFGVKCELAQFGTFHWIYTVTAAGMVDRQCTVQGYDVKTWREAIKRLLSDTPQPLW